MTEQGVGVVRPLPGDGLIAHVGGLLLVCDAADAVAEELLSAVRETAASGGDGRALARRAAQVLARSMTAEPIACALAGPVGGGIAVLVSGDAQASITGPGTEVRLDGKDALTWTDRLVAGPVSAVELRLPDAGPPIRRARLDAGVIPGGGVICSFTEGQDAGGPAAEGSGNVRQAMAADPFPGPDPVTASGPSGLSGPSGASASPGRPGPSGGASLAEPEPSRPEPGAGAPYGMGAAPMSVPSVPSLPEPAPLASAPPPEREHEASPSLLTDPEMAAVDPGAAPGGPGEGEASGFESYLLEGGEDRPDTPGALLEPTEAGPAPEPLSRPMVYGVDCKNDHFNDPRVPYCAVCGIALVQRTLVPYKGERPPLGVLLLDDGLALTLDGDYLLGRDPERAPEVTSGEARPARVTSPDGSVSRRHLRVRLDGWDVNLIDLGSVNGTQVQPPGDPNFYDIPPNEPVPILPGTTVRVGVSRTMRYESHRTD
ncbi:FHA domain-containing protein [Sphaerisporangium sp. NPDC005289]|uniref:FHA domain-containing protein n=1 Tax=Sphaerisporangium sp. NPDC005289 TaxID=3155247 RepID=UPI0033BADAF4